MAKARKDAKRADRLTSITGRLSVQGTDSGTGAGFVTPDAPACAARASRVRKAPPGKRPGTQKHGHEGFRGDIFIHPAHMGDAWHGDRVRVLLLPGRRGKSPEGRIVEVLERARREVAAKVLHRVGDEFLCRAADPRLPAMFRVDASALAKRPAKDEVLLVVPGERLASDLWAATASVDFGVEEDVAVQEQLVKLNHQVPRDFPRPVLEEAAAFPEDPAPEDQVGREDLTELPFVTIDGETARDFDDAIFVRKTKRGFRLHVAVADVAHYVRPGSALDKEARERANSWYFPVSVEPMLPPALSNVLCSLNPGRERLVVAVEMDVDGGGVTGAARFSPARIRSAARLTYGQVQDFLDGDGRTHRDISAPVQASLRAAAELAAVLLSRRKERGGLDFELPEPAYSFDGSGRIAAITRRDRLFSHRLIEECMIAVNEAVARFLEGRGLPVLYRVHPLPEPERLTALFRSLRTVEWTRPMPQRPSAGDLAAFLRAAHGTPQEFLVGRLCLRAMMQARYQPENEGHFGLASGAYCHFTSPIRRYADIVVHRALKYALGLFSGPLFSGGRLLALADRLSRRERAAMEAEREMARRLAVLLLAERVGERFDGVISSVNEFGFFVELADLPVEGLVRLMCLADDAYVYDPDRQRLLGRNTGRQFRLGQPLRVALADVHKGRLEIHLIPEEQAGFSPASRRKRSGGRRV
ncbi:MAG: VacB/RNase II family 3'-5' exoribonuclease [Deltaproteobacteria bacterium]|jgi:ribonuclease R|nr:VacB/RNase II family 3'-5' exoribonuclease [Deltaproteobacteria bacterium]